MLWIVVLVVDDVHRLNYILIHFTSSILCAEVLVLLVLSFCCFQVLFPATTTLFSATHWSCFIYKNIFKSKKRISSLTFSCFQLVLPLVPSLSTSIDNVSLNLQNKKTYVLIEEEGMEEKGKWSLPSSLFNSVAVRLIQHTILRGIDQRDNPWDYPSNWKECDEANISSIGCDYFINRGWLRWLSWSETLFIASHSRAAEMNHLTSCLTAISRIYCFIIHWHWKVSLGFGLRKILPTFSVRAIFGGEFKWSSECSFFLTHVSSFSGYFEPEKLKYKTLYDDNYQAWILILSSVCTSSVTHIQCQKPFFASF